jgi:predicted SAM-dependent methyltransferase
MSLKLQVDRLARDASGSAGIKLQLGCGQNILQGWLNTDSTPSPVADYLDFVKPFPFAANIFAAVFCEHTIEHIAKPEARHMISEAYRVLRPGGLFRVVTPSLENFCRMVLEPESEPAIKYMAWFRTYTNNPKASMTDAINLCFYGHGHRHLYTGDELASALRAVGFTAIRVMPAGNYGDPVFNGVDGHGRVIGDEINTIEAMALEAAKPVS